MYCNTKQRKFVLADTEDNTIDGRFNTVVSYYAINFQFSALVSLGSVGTNKDTMPMTIHRNIWGGYKGYT